MHKVIFYRIKTHISHKMPPVRIKFTDKINPKGGSPSKGESECLIYLINQPRREPAQKDLPQPKRQGGLNRTV